MTSRYLMIGGFLGAGKTTLIQRFAQYLDAKGLSVGLITNDQGAGLVDSAIGRSNRFPVEEISGGCFCCRFQSLVEAAENLTESTRPNVLLAEPVGSCTDLVATVSLPLQQIYGDSYVVAPLAVLVDPIRAAQVLGIEGKKKFSENVLYIYRKQLEEAEFIVVNKVDLLDTAQKEALVSALEEEFPRAKVFVLSARDGSGCEEWFDAFLSAKADPRSLDIDYERYADGEALLGWFNAIINIFPNSDDQEEFDGNELLTSMALALKEELENSGSEVAHLKMTLTPIGDPYEIGAVNLVRGESSPEASHRLFEPLDDGELLINLRAEADPELLESAATEALEAVIIDQMGRTFSVTHVEHFRPGKPVPTHRIVV